MAWLVRDSSQKSYDYAGDRLRAAHTVRLFAEVGGTHLPVPGGTVTVPAGINAPLIGGYRFQALLLNRRLGRARSDNDFTAPSLASNENCHPDRDDHKASQARAALERPFRANIVLEEPTRGGARRLACPGLSYSALSGLDHFFTVPKGSTIRP